MENRTVEEMREFFNSLTEHPNFLETEISIVKTPRVAIENHLAVIDELIARHGTPRKNATNTEINAFEVMKKRKSRLLDIYYSIQDKANWMERLPTERD